MYQPDSRSFLASSSMTVSDLSSGYHSLPKSSLFVPDTPAFCVKIHGNSSNDWLRISSTGIAPLRGSPEAALTCCGIFISISKYLLEILRIHDFMTGQEYHYTCCLSSPCQQQSDSQNQILFAPWMKQIRQKPFLLSSRGISLPFSHSHHGGLFHIAYAHHDNNRNVPDEWISNYQGAPIYHLSGNRQEMIFLTCFPLLEQKVACETLFF